MLRIVFVQDVFARLVTESILFSWTLPRSFHVNKFLSRCVSRYLHFRNLRMEPRFPCQLLIEVLHFAECISERENRKLAFQLSALSIRNLCILYIGLAFWYDVLPLPRLWSLASEFWLCHGTEKLIIWAPAFITNFRLYGNIPMCETHKNPYQDEFRINWATKSIALKTHLTFVLPLRASGLRFKDDSAWHTATRIKNLTRNRKHS